MGTCERFEKEALDRLERELPLGDHFDRCPDCRESRATHERLKRIVAEATPWDEPPRGWQQGVWSAIAAQRRTVRAPWKDATTWIARRAWIGLAAAAVLVLAIVAPRIEPPGISRIESPEGVPAGLRVELARPIVLRGASQPGPVLTLRGSTGGARHAELRVYFVGGEPPLRCSSAPPCMRDGEAISARFQLEAQGEPRPVLIVSDRPIPEPRATYEEDVRAAEAAGARLVLAQPAFVP